MTVSIIHMICSLPPSITVLPPSPSLPPSVSPSPSQRPSVVIKTHAATGQRTGNVISAVWQAPVIEAQAQVGGGANANEQTDSLGPSVQVS